MTEQTHAGRTILITGGSSGLGRRFAVMLAAAGAKVAVCARRTDRLADLVSEIQTAGGTAAAFAMDVQDEASVIAAFEAAQEQLGPIDTVIANAGMNNEGLAVDLPVEDFRTVLDINVTGAFLTAREGARRMMAAGSKDTGRGRIVLIASIGAHKVLPGLAVYCASKAAVAHMGKTLAREWANRGINVNVVCPGYIETEINSDWFASEGGKKQIASFPRRRLMDPSDLDPVIAWLTSDASKSVTGSVVTVDDGQSI
ncbi:SDR family oxidoreductase [Caulobacter sp. NIBR1757]|uniref:SDR family NAD(P)-dependent oxidoreductase n=1 Tax=Caulobacter sp. NIBR1757 TaxID=3016000 RepID=UPI0022F0452F|nr:SDR family oxidoreductase [Caulobacter sp. NIBR1757]WGM39451.1 Glucose 1-dehydrogenase [Caulobacter sp. NIBR1757]